MEATENKENGTAGVALYPNVTPLVMRLKDTEKAHEFTGHVSIEDYNRYIEASREWHIEGREMITENASESVGYAIYDKIVKPVGYSGAVPSAHKSFVIGTYLRMDTAVDDAGSSFNVSVRNCGRDVVLKFRRPTDAEFAESERALSATARSGDKSYYKGRCKTFLRMGRSMLLSASGYEDCAAEKIPVHHVVEAAIAVFKAGGDELEIDLGN